MSTTISPSRKSAAVMHGISAIAKKSLALLQVSKFLPTFAVRNHMNVSRSRSATVRGSNMLGHFLCPYIYIQQPQAAAMSSQLWLCGEKRLCGFATGHGSRLSFFTAYNAKSYKQMSTANPSAPQVLIPVQARKRLVMHGISAIMTISTVLGVAIDSDILTSVSAFVALSCVCSLSMKGGAR